MLALMNPWNPHSKFSQTAISSFGLMVYVTNTTLVEWLHFLASFLRHVQAFGVMTNLGLSEKYL